MENWVYGRPELAEHFLNSLNIGIVNRLALFAPRRRGKTLFLIHDLIPLAEKSDYFPVYASLWDNLDHPHIPILQNLREAKRVINKRGKLRSLLAIPLRKVTIGNTMLKADIEFAQNPVAPTHDELTEMSSLITAIANVKKSKSLLLLIDEVQHIATHDKFKTIAYTLRTAADKNNAKVKIVFTGSSRTGMSKLFDKNNAAFYNSVERFDFPVLDDGCIAACLAKLTNNFNINPGFKSLKVCFIHLDHSPYWFMSTLFKMILHNMPLKQAFEIVNDEIIELEGYENIYNKLGPLDRLLLVAVTQKEREFFSESTAKKYSHLLKKSVKVTTLQYSMNKLIKQQLITKLGRSDYVIERPGLGQYVVDKNSGI